MGGVSVALGHSWYGETPGPFRFCGPQESLRGPDRCWLVSLWATGGASTHLEVPPGDRQPGP